MPLRVPREMFLRNTPSASGSPYDVSVYAALVLARPFGKGVPAGVYRIRRARHAGALFTEAGLVAAHGDHLIVAVHPVDGKVGFARSDLLWVHPSHRGHHLGGEMVAELFVAMGCETWTLDQWQERLDTPTFTAAGHRNRYGVYDVLVRRGIIDS